MVGPKSVVAGTIRSINSVIVIMIIDNSNSTFVRLSDKFGADAPMHACASSTIYSFCS